jgi:hypothetical protein
MIQNIRDGLRGPVRLEYRDLKGDVSRDTTGAVMQFDDLREAVAAAITKAPLPTLTVYLITDAGEVLSPERINELWWRLL